MRICSLLPSATELLYALGAGDDIVGVSHECDYPPQALEKPRVVRTTVDQEHLSSAEIDQIVRDAVAHQASLYELDQQALAEARPDLVVTQELCEVCAIDTTHVSRALSRLPFQPRVVALHPHGLEDVFKEAQLLGDIAGHREVAEELVRSCRARIEQVRKRVATISARPRVLCLEWLEPLMGSGHWVPEMVELAGGMEVLGRAGEPSRDVTSEEVVHARPEILVLMPCGFSIARARKEVPRLTTQAWWTTLPAVRSGRVYLVNGPAYFNRSGPRLVDGIELLAALLHPDQCADLMPPQAAESLVQAEDSKCAHN